MATQALLVDLVALWRAAGGIEVTCQSVGGVEAAKRVAAGERFDLVVLAEDAIDRLVASGHAIGSTKTDLTHSSVAIAARHEDAHRRIEDEATLKAAVVAARRIAVSTGPSGEAIRQLFARWDIASSFGERLVQAPPGIPVGRLVAEGTAELGFQQLSELQNISGIDILGLMPPGLEIVTTFSGACVSAGKHRAASLSVLQFWNSSAASPLKRRHGMDPAIR